MSNSGSGGGFANRYELTYIMRLFLNHKSEFRPCFAIIPADGFQLCKQLLDLSQVRSITFIFAALPADFLDFRSDHYKSLFFHFIGLGEVAANKDISKHQSEISEIVGMLETKISSRDIIFCYDASDVDSVDTVKLIRKFISDRDFHSRVETQEENTKEILNQDKKKLIEACCLMIVCVSGQLNNNNIVISKLRMHNIEENASLESNNQLKFY